MKTFSDQLLETDGIFASPAAISEEKIDPRLQRAIELAPQIGWRKSLDASYDSSLIDYVTNPSRLCFVDILPTEPASAVLEIGPGLGQMTVELSKRFARVDAIDADLQQARFCQIRYAQEGLQNVRAFAGGEDGKLPFPDNYYDCVVMNLVLEWCGIRRQGESHDDVQRRYLIEIFRVLKPGGFLYVSTKNRYSIRLILGGRDEHIFDMPFGSCLPRFLTKAIAKGQRPPGHLYSWPALRAMLVAAGFRQVEPYVAVPDPRWPSKYVPAAQLTRTDIKSKGQSRRVGIALKVLPPFLFRLLSPGITFVTRK